VLLILGGCNATPPVHQGRCCFDDVAACCARAATANVMIGLLASTNPHLYELEAVRKGLNENGYFEGRNLAIISRSADSQLEQLPRL